MTHILGSGHLPSTQPRGFMTINLLLEKLVGARCIFFALVCKIKVLKGLFFNETPCHKKRFSWSDTDTQGGRIPEAQVELRTETGGLRPARALTACHLKDGCE